MIICSCDQERQAMVPVDKAEREIEMVELAELANWYRIEPSRRRENWRTRRETGLSTEWVWRWEIAKTRTKPWLKLAELTRAKVETAEGRAFDKIATVRELRVATNLDFDVEGTIVVNANAIRVDGNIFAISSLGLKVGMMAT
jgi:hypothetical protein